MKISNLYTVATAIFIICSYALTGCSESSGDIQAPLTRNAETLLDYNETLREVSQTYGNLMAIVAQKTGVPYSGSLTPAQYVEKLDSAQLGNLSLWTSEFENSHPTGTSDNGLSISEEIEFNNQLDLYLKKRTSDPNASIDEVFTGITTIDNYR